MLYFISLRVIGFGVSDLTPFYVEHRTVALLSSAFIHPIRHPFLLAALCLLSATDTKGVSYFLGITYWEGQVSVVPEMACLTAQEQAARNGVRVPQREMSLSLSWQGSAALRNRCTDPPHLLPICLFTLLFPEGKAKRMGTYRTYRSENKTMHLKSTTFILKGNTF